MKTIRVLCLLLCMLFAFSQVGCVPLLIGAAAGVGTVVYIKGTLEENVNASAHRTYEAAIAALTHMHMPITEDQHDNMTAKVKSRFADGKHVWIDIEAEGEGSCKLQVRVGTFGDEYRSRKILDEIHKQL